MSARTIQNVKEKRSTNGKPELNAGDQDFSRITPLALNILCQANKPPRLFLYGGIPVRLECNDDGSPILRELSQDRMT
jgi:hypothetical protein